jgi:hypothetical protein
MIPSKHLDVLRQVQERLRDSGVTWVITGSLGLALQGVETDVHDIDVQSDRAGAHQIEELFADYVVRRVALLEDERVRSHLGALEIDGIEVEIIGDIQKRVTGGPWEPPPDLARLATTVEAEGTQVPVLRLEYERDAYRKMGRPDKAELIAAALRRRL